MESIASRLLEHVLKHYRDDEFCCLLAQYSKWSKTKPFQDMKIFDATPLFQNTLAKIAPLIASGADVTIGIHSGCTYDPKIVALLQENNVKVVDDVMESGEYDVVLDCAGAYHRLKPNLGFAELTRSGEKYYVQHDKPCFSADLSIIKYFEDYLGTADGLMRALVANNIDIAGKRVVVFGHGKVGSGICQRLEAVGVELCIVEDLKTQYAPSGSMIDYRDKEKVYDALENAFAVIMVTGGRDVISHFYDINRFIDSDALLINMGAEDEYGTKIPAERVLNGKQPLNFGLPEPTLLCYIDATLALHNEAVGYYLSHKPEPGLVAPPKNIELNLINLTIENSCISGQVKEFLLSKNYSGRF